jgi:hypothetical protein
MVLMAKTAAISRTVPSDPTAGYWNFAAGAIILMYIVYITAKGELGSYIQLFFYTAPGTPAGKPTSDPAAATQSNAPVIGQGGTLFQNPGGTAPGGSGAASQPGFLGGIGSAINKLFGINPAK